MVKLHGLFSHKNNEMVINPFFILDLLKMIFYFLHGKSTSWVIYREYFLFFGGSLSKSMIMFSRACNYVYFQFEHNGNFPTVKGLATTWLALFSNSKISNTFILDIQGIHFPSTYFSRYPRNKSILLILIFCPLIPLIHFLHD